MQTARFLASEVSERDIQIVSKHVLRSDVWASSEHFPGWALGNVFVLGQVAIHCDFSPPSCAATQCLVYTKVSSALSNVLVRL